MTSSQPNESHETSDRLREHPETRFAPPEHQFDLQAAARELALEPIAAPRRHRQRTLYRHGRMTIAMFLFEAGASLPSHLAAGTVAINVLEGRLRIRTPGGEHVLNAGNLLVLASKVSHDVLAEEKSTMLLQVHLDEPAAARE